MKLFVQQKRKHREMAFLMSRSASRHILFTLGVDPTARDAGEGGGSDLVSQATPFTVSCETRAVHVPSLHKSSIAKPEKMSSKLLLLLLLLYIQHTNTRSSKDT